MQNSARNAEHQYFYPRPPRGGRPELPADRYCCRGISIHALREEGDDGGKKAEIDRDDFYPRPPRGGRRQITGTASSYARFLSTPSARRATGPLHADDVEDGISIHALREEGDRSWLALVRASTLFLSTPSARRAT